METIISYLDAEFLIIPIIVIMILGILVVPFLTPVLCAACLLGAFSGKIPLFRAPITLFLILLGLGVTTSIWFIDTGFDRINLIVDNPFVTLLVPLLTLVASLFEQRRLSIPKKWAYTLKTAAITGATSLYWMAIAATMSASV